MPNNFYRKRYVKLVGEAVARIHSLNIIDNEGAANSILQIIINNFLAPILPDQFTFGKGNIIDNRENVSKEIDLVIHSKTFLPPIINSERDGVFPIESCFYAIEIKPRADKKEIEDAYQKARSICNLLIPDLFKVRIGKVNFPVIPGLLCFDTDLNYSDMNDLQRYCTIDMEGKSNPVIRFICIVGKGYWYFNQTRKEWAFSPSTEDYGEILSMISDISNTLLTNFNSRAGKSIGSYIINDK